MATETQYLVVGRTNATTRRGEPFCSLKLRDEEKNELNVAVWDVQPTDEPVVGQIVEFFNIQDSGGKKSARKLDMHVGRMVQEGDVLYDLLPHPVKKEEWDRCIRQLLTYCSDAKLKGIIGEYAEILYAPYSKYPAGTSMHHAFRGGLLNHTYQMLHMLEGIYPCLPYPVKPEYCTLAILFHDYGKVYEYKADGGTRPMMYLLGHVYISANRLQAELEKQGVAEKDVDMIVHIVLAHHGSLEFGSPVMPCTQEAILINMLDNLSAKADNWDGTGNMEKSFALGTTVVKSLD